MRRHKRARGPVESRMRSAGSLPPNIRAGGPRIAEHREQKKAPAKPGLKEGNERLRAYCPRPPKLCADGSPKWKDSLRNKVDNSAMLSLRRTPALRGLRLTFRLERWRWSGTILGGWCRLP